MIIVVRVMAAVLPSVRISVPPTFAVPWLASSKIDVGLVTSAVAPMYTDIELFFARCSRSVLSGGNPFSYFARTFELGLFPIIASRCRDILPLPRPSRKDLEDWTPVIDLSIAHRILILVAASLNYMFLGRGYW